MLPLMNELCALTDLSLKTLNYAIIDITSGVQFLSVFTAHLYVSQTWYSVEKHLY